MQTVIEKIIKTLLNNNLTIEEIKKQPRQIREVVYTYFHDTDFKYNEGEKPLTFKDIARLISEDNEFNYIINIPSKYFVDITLTKLHEQDNMIKPNPTFSLLYDTPEIKGQSVDYYMNQGKFDLVNKIVNRSECVSLECVCIKPDLFEPSVLAKRFGLKLNPLKFSDLQIRNKFIYETLIRLPRKVFIPEEFYTNDENVLLEILEKHPPKILPENFDTLVTSKNVADAYVKWFLV